MALIALIQAQLSRSPDVDDSSVSGGRVWKSLRVAVNQLAAEQIVGQGVAGFHILQGQLMSVRENPVSGNRLE